MSRLPTELEPREYDNTQAGETRSDMMEEESSSHHSKASGSRVGMNDMMNENRVNERQHSFKNYRGCDSSPGHPFQFLPTTIIISNIYASILFYSILFYSICAAHIQSLYECMYGHIGDMTSLKNLVENCLYIPMRLSFRCVYVFLTIFTIFTFLTPWMVFVSQYLT